MVDAAALDHGAVPRGVGVVDGEQESLPLQQGLDGQDGTDGDVLGRSADGADSDVALAELGGDAGGAEPRGDGAATGAEEDAQQQQGQAGGTAAVEPVGEVAKGVGHRGGEVR
jgi:hypothetical protein